MKYKWELRETVGLFGFFLVLATLYFGLIYTGPAKFFTAPNAQKLFYFHVPSGLVTYLAFLMVVGGSALYLYNQSHYADRVAKCSAELGIVFGFMSLASGTFWMKAEWGGDIVSRFLTDMRLATTLAMWILYIAYFVYRRQPETSICILIFSKKEYRRINARMPMYNPTLRDGSRLSCSAVPTITG